VKSSSENKNTVQMHCINCKSRRILKKYKRAEWHRGVATILH